MGNKTLEALVKHCIAQGTPRAATWQFAKDVTIVIPSDISSSFAEKSLVAWALAPVRDWSWLDNAAHGPTIHSWRDEQRELLSRIDQVAPGAIAFLEGGTGLGKTRVFGSRAHETSLSHQVVIAVPTLAVGAQWQAHWREFSDTPLAEVWGRAQYGDGDDANTLQESALRDGIAARAVLCTHQLLPKLLGSLSKPAHVYIDEAHLLPQALTGSSGIFAPASIFGPWLERWCKRNAPIGGLSGELELGGRMHDLVLKRLVPDQDEAQAKDWRTSVLLGDDGQAMLWARHSDSLDATLTHLWAMADTALLFSGTLGWTSSCGVRSVRMLSQRLCVPTQRQQDLGRVRPAWRDDGVTVCLPQARLASDKRLWLGAYRDRQEAWWEEVGAVLAELPKSSKTLVLLTSYKDVQGIATAMESVPGVFASEQGDSVSVGALRLAEAGNWCWLATGAAWTGLDLSTPLERLVIGKLPLPDPTTMKLLASAENAVFDAVSRLRQGIGRLVRGSLEKPVMREIMVLDGRVNDPSAGWRRICQPFLQILGEDFDDHRRF